MKYTSVGDRHMRLGLKAEGAWGFIIRLTDPCPAELSRVTGLRVSLNISLN